MGQNSVRAGALAALVAVATAARAETPVAVEAPPPQEGRGVLSAVGLGLVALGVGGAGLGVAGTLTAADAAAAGTNAINQGDPGAVPRLEERRGTGVALAATGWALAGAGLISGIVLLVVDGRAQAPAVSVLPTRGGGLVAYSFTW